MTPTLVALLVALVLQAAPGRVDEASLTGFTWRAIGPYRAGSWISDIAVSESPATAHLYTFYGFELYGDRQLIVPNDDGLLR